MNEPNQSVDGASPATGRADKWWTVRPVLGALLVGVVVAAVALVVTEMVPISVVRDTFRIEVPKWQEVEKLLVGLAGVSVIAVLIEAGRTGKLVLKRSAPKEIGVAT